MQDSDDFYSAEQIAALDLLGIKFTRVDWVRVAIATMPPLSLRVDRMPFPTLPIIRHPRCPIISRSEEMKANLVILPDGQRRFVYFG